MNTYTLTLLDREIAFYQLLSEQFLLLIDQDNHYSVLDLHNNKASSDFQALPQTLNVKNLRVSVALPYFALAEDYGQKGMVLSIRDKKYHYPFERGNYHVEHCSFPLALFEKEEEFHLIHGSDWNRVEQINLTKHSSLIPFNPEEEADKKLDYFHSSIQLSPNKEEFLSNGWMWSPFDIIYRFKLEDLHQAKWKNAQYVEIPPTTGYNWDRPLCWINNNLIAIGYTPQEDEEEKLDEQTPSEILIYDLTNDHINKKIRTDGFGVNEEGEVWGELYYHRELDTFIILNSIKGLTIIQRNGQTLYHNEALKNWLYSPELGLIYYLDGNQLQISSIKKLLR